MQPSEMTNDGSCFFAMEEDQHSFAFLRDYVWMRRQIAGLRKCLKVAEVALEKIDNMCDGDMCKFFDDTHHCSACRYLESCQTGVAHAALHEIRGKGGEDDK